ncbi:MAG: PHP domain-containing protein [Candidatus Micrarchaeota archaeon]|nr:PHP domain-containing protein [Candidatus Micrarchaeota archaeon]
MKVDMHIHTIYSGDSVGKPSGIIKAAASRGLDGVAVADHNTTKGWKEMLAEGRKRGISVILGEEVKVEFEGRVVGEVLGYFMNEEVKRGEVHEVLDAIADQGALAALPHPFCFLRGMKMDVEEIIGKVQAVEVFNSCVYFDYNNQKALMFARKHKLAEIGGSDAHTEQEVGNAYTYAEADEIKKFRDAILKRKTKAEGKLTSHALRFISKLLGSR